jgi:putative membrane protein
MRKTFPLLLAAVALAGCSSETTTAEETQDQPTMEAGDPAASPGAPDAASNDMPTDGAGYVAMAGASDLYEIQSSQMALEKTQNEQVREFAQMMIEHHQMTTQQVTTAAQEAGMMPAPPQLTPMQQELIAQLEGASGEQFDQTYLQQQRQAHQMALGLHSNFAENGDTPPLQQVAGEAVPIVESHIMELEGMNAGA